MALADDRLDDRAERRVVRERDDVDAGDHDLVDAALAELEHAADHLLLLGLDRALLPSPLDEDAQLLARDRLVGDVADAEHPRDDVGGRGEEPDDRPQQHAEQLDRTGEQEGVPLGVGERERLGHELPEHDRREAHAERDDEQRDEVSRPCERPDRRERVGERARDAGAGEGRGEEADERDAELDRGEQRSGPLDEVADAVGALLALVAELAQAAAADGDERDLGRHEHPVHDDEQGDDRGARGGCRPSVDELALRCGSGRGRRGLAARSGGGCVPARRPRACRVARRG